MPFAIALPFPLRLEGNNKDVDSAVGVVKMSQSPIKKKSKEGGRSYLISIARHPDIPPRQSSRSPPFPPRASIWAFGRRFCQAGTVSC